jgi:hypothetical protein
LLLTVHRPFFDRANSSSPPRLVKEITERLVELTWDERKRQLNIEKHNVDFLMAARMFSNPESVEFYSYPKDGENRAVAIGMVEGVWYQLAFVDRDDARRLISAWKLNEKSRKKAQARLARRAGGDGEKG